MGNAKNEVHYTRSRRGILLLTDVIKKSSLYHRNISYAPKRKIQSGYCRNSLRLICFTLLKGSQYQILWVVNRDHEQAEKDHLIRLVHCRNDDSRHEVPRCLSGSELCSGNQAPLVRQISLELCTISLHQMLGQLLFRFSFRCWVIME